MRNYDHSQLKAGDPAVYGNLVGFGGFWTITKTTVDRLTSTQIVMADGSRFRRSTGVKVGNSTYNSRLLNPKGSEVINALVSCEASDLSYELTVWQRENRRISTLDKWEICLAQLESKVAEAQRRVREIKEGL